MRAQRGTPRGGATRDGPHVVQAVGPGRHTGTGGVPAGGANAQPVTHASTAPGMHAMPKVPGAQDSTPLHGFPSSHSSLDEHECVTGGRHTVAPDDPSQPSGHAGAS